MRNIQIQNQSESHMNGTSPTISNYRYTLLPNLYNSVQKKKRGGSEGCGDREEGRKEEKKGKKLKENVELSLISTWYLVSFFCFMIVKPFSAVICGPFSHLLPIFSSVSFSESSFPLLWHYLCVCHQWSAYCQTFLILLSFSAKFNTEENCLDVELLSFLFFSLFVFFFMCVIPCFSPALMSTFQYPLMAYLLLTSLNVNVSLIKSILLLNDIIKSHCFKYHLSTDLVLP